MAWPLDTSGGSGTAFQIQNKAGGTVIRWGTSGIYGAYIVVSATPADEIESMYVENGTGLKAIRIMLWQGRKINVTVVDDHTIAPPAIGAKVTTICDPLNGGAAVTAGFTVIENSYNAARKEAGQRVMVLEYLTLVEGSGTVPPTGY